MSDKIYSKVTMQSIGDLLGVTKVTISKALNGHPGVSNELRKKIIDTAKEQGYKFTASKSIQVLVNMFTFVVPKYYFLENEDFYRTVYFHLNNECARNNITLSLLIIDGENSLESTILNHLKESHTDGIFIAGEVSDELFQRIYELGKPTVAIDFYKLSMPIDCVIVNNYDAGIQAANYLFSKGHKNIGFLGNPNQSSSIADRYFGYLKVLNSKNLHYNENWTIKTGFSSNSYSVDYNIPKELPTAFIAHCDMAAYHLILKFQCLGINVPSQLSVISFDNTELSRNFSPSITTIEINKMDLAKESFDMLIRRIENPTAAVSKILLSTKLIERETVSEFVKP